MVTLDARVLAVLVTTAESAIAVDAKRIAQMVAWWATVRASHAQARISPTVGSLMSGFGNFELAQLRVACDAHSLVRMKA